MSVVRNGEARSASRSQILVRSVLKLAWGLLSGFSVGMVATLGLARWVPVLGDVAIAAFGMAVHHRSGADRRVGDVCRCLGGHNREVSQALDSQDLFCHYCCL